MPCLLEIKFNVHTTTARRPGFRQLSKKNFIMFKPRLAGNIVGLPSKAYKRLARITVYDIDALRYS